MVKISQAELVAQEQVPIPPSLPAPLSGRALAVRLRDTSETTIRKRKLSPDFENWSRDRDPNHIGWRYDPDSKQFCPVNTVDRPVDKITVNSLQWDAKVDSFLGEVSHK